jgi:hypothetical protein
MKKVVITKGGFMKSKELDEILSTDEVMFEGDSTECNNYIHSIKPRR